MLLEMPRFEQEQTTELASFAIGGEALKPTLAETGLTDATTPSGLAGTQPLRATGGCDGDLCIQARSEAAEPLVEEAQQRWASRPLTDRLQSVRALRHWIAAHPELLANAISPRLARSAADTLVSEVLPLLDAIRFLERKALKLLAPRSLGRRGRPVWLTGVVSTVHREPLGHVLVLGPSNFPLFLPAVQVIQALVAGNAVTWKPGEGGRHVALLLAHALREAGLPRGLLRVTAESAAAGQDALLQHPDKVFLTGSLPTARRVLTTLAQTATPATMELSGADAVLVLPSADLGAASKAIAFGLRLNGAEVCMSPRRLVATAATLAALRPLLKAELERIAPVCLQAHTAQRLHDLLADAVQQGAEIGGSFEPAAQRPLLIERTRPSMPITQTDLFAPVLSVLEAPSVLHMAAIVNQSGMGLSATIFGDAREAATLASELRVGAVVINDLIAPTVDPRVPFGGRRQSGYGVTRGAEGLLEMTVPKVVFSRRKTLTRHYEPLTARDVPLFAGGIGLLHGGSFGGRWRALKDVIRAVRSR